MIGLVLSFKGTNYGMMLQAYATQAYLDLNNYDSEIITVSTKKTIKEHVDRIIRHLSPTSLSASIKKRKRTRLIRNDVEIYNAYTKRMNVGKTFVEKRLHGVVTYNGYNQLTAGVKNKYSCVLIGSDQQWAPACFYNRLNTLQFVPEGVVRASYATSMGVSKIPKYTEKKLKSFISKMDFVSVRENTAKNIISTVSGRDDIKVVPDPTFLLSREEWLSFIADEILVDVPYIFCYFLGNSPEPIKIVNDYAKTKGLKVVAIRNIESYSKEKVDYGDALVLDGPSVEEFVNYIRHADIVCTDSFHATVFSIINNSDFVTFYRTSYKDKNSRNSRIDDLLNTFSLEDHIFREGRDFNSILSNKIDFDRVNGQIEQLRSSGSSFLDKVLKSSKKNIYSNVSEFEKSECCGCGVCVIKCHQNAISMEEDKEGFAYPVVENKACIGCGICVKNCPTHNREHAKVVNYSNAYYAYNVNPEECKKSASGGVAAGLYKVFIENGAVIFGAKYTDDFKNVIMESASKKSSIEQFLGSKYVKSNENGTFIKVKQLLKNGKKVFYVGLPCEISALKNYLGKDEDELYTCELICHGPTTYKALKDYISKLENSYGSLVTNFNCRAKKPYWKPYYISVRFENESTYEVPFTNSSLEKAFQAVKRPSCNKCAFKDQSSCSDLIIGDFHGAKQGTDEYNPFGVSICFPVTGKGVEMLDLLKNEGFTVGDANESRAKANRALFTPIEELDIRERFVNLLINQGLDKAANDIQVNNSLKRRKVKMKVKIYAKALRKKIGL